MVNIKNKKRDLKELKELNPNTFLKIGELAVLIKVRHSTLVYYADLNILPYVQEGTKLSRKFQIKAVIKRLGEIEKLKQKDYSLEDIQKHYNGK